VTFPFGVVADDETWRMEQFSRAYVQAISSAAGCSSASSSVDDDSVDLTLMRRRIGSTIRSPRLDVQLKATYTDCIDADHISYPLPIKNYDDLRPTNLAVPRILVVVTMNADAGQWLLHSEANLALYKCGYWLSLHGFPSVSNTTTKTVHLPRLQVFNATNLHDIFLRLEAGQLP